MNQKSDIPGTKKHSNATAAILKRAAAIGLSPILMTLILFLAAGRLDWIWAWAYLGINLANVLVVSPITIHTNPESPATEGGLKSTGKWDAAVSAFYLLTMYIALPLVAGLHMRLGWARDLSIPCHVAGGAVIALALAVTAWAMVTNQYMFSTVSVQRGQAICSSGPYRLVRHPGYLGLILQALGVPILLGSLWALIPGIAAAVCMVLATSLEDRTLQAYLPGYQAYALKVRFRLVPSIW